MDARQVYEDAHVAELATAAQDGSRLKVSALIAAGVDKNARGDKGINLLQWSILHASTAGLDALLKAGANPAQQDASGSTAMHFAAGTTDPQFLATLIANGAPIDVRNRIGETPIFAALLGGRDPQFQRLIAAGANVNATDDNGNTPLHVAGKVNNLRAALALLDAGADPKALNAQGVTFMRYVHATPANFRTDEARSEYEAIVRWLADHGLHGLD